MTDTVIQTASVPKIALGYRFQWEPAQDCHVLLYPEGMVKLSGSAAEIMKRIDGKASIAEIVSGLKEQFPGVELDADVMKFMEIAHGNSWIRFV